MSSKNSDEIKKEHDEMLKVFVDIYIHPIKDAKVKSLLADVEGKIYSPKSLDEGMKIAQNIKEKFRDEIFKYLDIKNADELDDDSLINVFSSTDYHKLKRNETSAVDINFRQLKTNKITSTPLLPEAMAIIEQNRDAQDGYALPRMSSQKINENIKLIAKKAGITAKVLVDTYKRGKLETKEYEKWQILGTHFGRKTFISVAASKGISVVVVASIVGQNIKTTMKHYLGVLEKDKVDELMSKMKFSDGKKQD